MPWPGDDDDEGPGEGWPMMPGRGRPMGRVVLRVAHPVADGDQPERMVGSMNMRLDTFFSSGLQILEQLLSLRGRLQTLGQIQVDLNQMIFDHVVQMSLQDQGPQGPPPVEKEDLSRLPEVDVTSYHLREDANHKCTICLDTFDVGSRVKQLPCGHIFCVGCVDEWLGRHRTCPVCRTEVKDLLEPQWEFSKCGFQQQRKKECFLSSAQPLVVLAGCSHGFHRACLKRHMGPRMKEKADSFKIDCPLCKVASTVLMSDLVAPGTPPPGVRPLSPLEAESSEEEEAKDEPPTPPQNPAISIRDILRNKRANQEILQRNTTSSSSSAATPTRTPGTPATTASTPGLSSSTVSPMTATATTPMHATSSRGGHPTTNATPSPSAGSVGGTPLSSSSSRRASRPATSATRTARTSSTTDRPRIVPVPPGGSANYHTGTQALVRRNSSRSGTRPGRRGGAS